MRPSWDETFMAVAEVFAKRSTCLFYKVGVCFVKNKHLLTVGYNEPPSGFSKIIINPLRLRMQGVAFFS